MWLRDCQRRDMLASVHRVTRLCSSMQGRLGVARPLCTACLWVVAAGSPDEAMSSWAYLLRLWGPRLVHVTSWQWRWDRRLSFWLHPVVVPTFTPPHRVSGLGASAGPTAPWDLLRCLQLLPLWGSAEPRQPRQGLLVFAVVSPWPFELLGQPRRPMRVGCAMGLPRPAPRCPGAAL